MKKTLTVMTMVIALAMSAMAPAMASQELGRQGNNACGSANQFDNPGQMWQAVLNNTGMTPAERAEYLGYDSVAHFMYDRCN